MTLGKETRKSFPLRTAVWEKPKFLSLAFAEFPTAVGFFEGLVPSAGPGPGPGAAGRSRPGEFLWEECGRVSRAGRRRAAPLPDSRDFGSSGLTGARPLLLRENTNRYSV